MNLVIGGLLPLLTYATRHTRIEGRIRCGPGSRWYRCSCNPAPAPGRGGVPGTTVQRGGSFPVAQLPPELAAQAVPVEPPAPVAGPPTRPWLAELLQDVAREREVSR